MSPDNTNTNNDIDALLRRIEPLGIRSVVLESVECARYHAALTALVADRDALKAQCDKRFDFATIKAHIAEQNALKQRVAELERDVDMWREDAHKWKKMYDCHYESERIWISRVVELERQVESQPPADRDRELRERLIESALHGAGCSSLCDDAGAKALGRQAVWMVDGALAAMRKGEANGK